MLHRLERIFGKPADYEVRRAAKLLFLLLMLAFFVGVLAPLFRLVLEHVVTGPNAEYEVVIVGFAANPVLAVIGAILGAVIGARINRRASPQQQLMMLRCLDVAIVIAGVALGIHFISLSRAGITPQLYLVLAAICFLLAARSFRPVTRLVNFLGGSR